MALKSSKMKISMLASVGQSPPVVTELAQYLMGKEGWDLTDVVLISTTNIVVQRCVNLAEVALRVKYPRIRTHVINLPFEDISSTDDTIQFMRSCAKAIKDEREKYGCERIYLNVAGGRKDMCISLAMLGQWLEIDGIYHVIDPNIQVMNTKLEQMRQDIADLHNISTMEEKLKFYNTKKEDFDTLMFPTLRDLKFVQIPCIPYPKDFLGKVVKLLVSDYVFISDVDLDMDSLKFLKRANLITIMKDKVAPTYWGRTIGKIWR